MSIEALSGKVFMIVTGASRGIGKQIAITFGSLLEKGSHAVLLATNLEALKETARNFPSHVTVDPISVDLSKAQKEVFHDIVTKALKNRAPSEFDRVVLVHNVGTMGNLSAYANNLTDLNEWRNYFDLNVFGPAILNGVVMNIFNEDTNTEKTVINITSLFGIQAEKNAGHYGSGKAAREMFFKIFAIENPKANVLNYSPGPVETDMFYQACNTFGDKEVKKYFTDMLEKKTYLTCEQTVNRLLNILKEHKYKPGDHVDYFDEL
ncbi:sepiapterin reductase [Calliopsis andreniformis]|uniref:sepiapterin reductase n=1 Tax=Calliopsis andreniformis TaxID=337506 RepID=UPI003FCC5C68